MNNTKNRRKNKKKKPNTSLQPKTSSRSNILLQSNKEFPSLPTKKIVQKIIHNNNIIYKKAYNGYIYLQSLPLLENSCTMQIFY